MPLGRSPAAKDALQHVHSDASWRAWMREPLLHFLVLGALLFAVDAFVNADRSASTILVNPEVDAEARSVFRAARDREPTVEELAVLRQRWIDNEVLYREGVAMQLDRGDSAIRERLIFKSLSVIDARLKAPPQTEVALRAWFDARRARYDEPPRYDFLEAVPSGERDEAAVRSLVNQLNDGHERDTNASLRVFKGRPVATLNQSYGEHFAEALSHASEGRWEAVESKSGWRAIRLDATTPGQPADFNKLRNVIAQDWIDATMAELRSAEVAKLARKYDIRVEAGTP